MRSHRWIPALLLAGLFALQSAVSNAQEAIGKATSVKPQVEGSQGGTLSGGSDVYEKETVRTGQAGQADLRFKDSSNLKVGPSSSVNLDKLEDVPNKNAGTVDIQATHGSFRFSSPGKGTNYQIKSPYGTLGVRD
jgi:hypothetical protein